MAYSNGRSNYGNSRPSGGYNNNGGSFQNGYGNNQNGGNRSNQGQNNGRSGPPKRTSGCAMKSSYTRKGTGEVVNAPVLYGWMRAYGQFLSWVGVPNKDPGTKSDRWKKFVITITPGFAAPYLTTGFWDTQKKRMSIPDLGLLADPNYQNGGYTLKLSKKR